MEREVREMLKSKSNRAPAMNEPPKPVLRRARTRKVTNSISLAVIVAILAVGGFAGVRALTATRTDGFDAPRGSVPWAPIQAPAPGTDIPCLGRDLNMSADAGAGSSLMFAAKRSDVRCTLVPNFALKLFDQQGKELDVRVSFAQTFPGLVVVGASRRAAFFEWGNGCAPTTGPIRFTVTLPEGFGTLSAVATNGGELTCTATRSPGTLTFVAGGGSTYGDVYASQSSLESWLSGVPRSVSVGDTLKYYVTLHNPTRKPISLDPCPIYGERVSVGVSYATAWLLNCVAAPSEIRPGASLRFAMEFTVPSEGRGRAELRWQMPELGVPDATAHFTIT